MKKFVIVVLLTLSSPVFSGVWSEPLEITDVSHSAEEGGGLGYMNIGRPTLRK